MMGRIPDDVLQTIRERTSIVEVVSGYIALKRAGRNYLGLCPFHGEKTPSFTVSDERGLYHCFGCSAGGSVFSFIMQIDHVSFREAVEVLARRAGIDLPRSDVDELGERNRSALLEVNGIAQQYFADALRSKAGAAAREYMSRRGFEGPLLEQYGVGFSPLGGGLSQVLRAKKIDLGRAIEVGLAGKRADGSLYDRFRGRVMFPIRDSTGRVVGFGGRTLGTDQPKYLNSPESPVFRKGSVLYGLYEAREAIRVASRVVLVEGYLDALALVQHGIGCAVATLGTALGVTQLRLARRFAPELIAFFDGDRAGRDAAVRAFGVCVQADVWGLAAFLPDGFDPDTFVHQHGVEATQALLSNATPLADFFLDRSIPGANATVPQRVSAAKVVGEVLVQVKDSAQFDLLARAAAQRLGVDEILFRELRQQRSTAIGVAKPMPAISPDIGSTNRVLRPEEAALVEAAMLDRKAAMLISESNVASLFSDDKLAQAVTQAVECWKDGTDVSVVLPLLPSNLAARVSGAFLGQGPIAVADLEAVARDCIRRVKDRQQRSKVSALRAQLSRVEASGNDQQYLTELRRVDDVLRRRSGVE